MHPQRRPLPNGPRLLPSPHWQQSRRLVRRLRTWTRDQPDYRRGHGRTRHRHRHEFPKPWTDETVRAADVVITMGCGDACPIFPGKRYESWELDDPHGQDLDTVRRIRDELERRVRTLISSLQL
ncbi:protein of unknown function [Micropruina glycogenica]|uniref:Phosphotyrosine protein phosphatase I domain-containing protein n=1 Tax=Micropruina glycogenica TaxID=75385 RepID=A0A2N9JDC2_9ACTN|nr:protein of unknown function [Micropruina glycogenica]